MIRTLNKILILFIVAAIGILLVGCDDEYEKAADRLEEAFQGISVDLGGTDYSSLRDFLDNTDNFYPNGIAAIIDFEKDLSRAKVKKDDFHNAREYIDSITDTFYRDIGDLFLHTDKLKFSIKNTYVLNPEKDLYRVPSGWNEITKVPIQISKFVGSDNKELMLDTEYGFLHMYSDFFYGKATGGRSDLTLILAYEKNDENSDTPIIILRLEDSNGKNVEHKFPGQSAVITIPLSCDFMTNDEGNPYNAVEYVSIKDDGSDGEERGILPRSFIDDENLYIYVNRPGKFYLTSTENGKTSNKADFLKDRGITLSGKKKGDQVLVTRGEMYDSLMSIHWVENLFHDIDESISLFPDPELPSLPSSDKKRSEYTFGERLVQHLIIGKNLDAFPLNGKENGYFHPNDPLLRGELIRILAGYIKAFGAEVDGLLKIPYNIKGKPDENDYWYEEFKYLEEKQFVPHRRNGNKTDIAADEFVTLEEAREILCMLITGRKFS